MFARKKKFLCNPKAIGNHKRVNRFFIFFDTETSQKEVKNKNIGHKQYDLVDNWLQMGWACFYDMQTDYEEWFYFTENKTFHQWCSKKFTQTKNATIWFVAHNVEFDLTITDFWTFMKKRKFTSEFIHSKGMVFIQKFKRNKKNILLVNNGNIFAEKLEKLGQILNLPKLEVNFKKDSIDYIKVYCKRDVEILVEFWKFWIKFLKENKLGNVKFTISSQAMEAFKSNYCKDIIVLDDNIKNLEFERRGYYGGRTEIFHVGEVRKKLYYYDVNSMYPFAMKENKMPTEFKFFRDNPAISYVSKLLKKGWLIMAECYIQTNERVYPYKEDTLLFPVGSFKTYLATPEIEYAIEHGDLKKFGRVSFYHSANIFHDYIEFVYNKRLEMKAIKDPREKMYKLFMNSLYGKFGQLNDKWEQISESEIQNNYPDFTLDEFVLGNYKFAKMIFMGEDITPRCRFIGNELQVSKEITESNISFPAIAAHVTSYARMVLWDHMKACKKTGIKIYYCDTDSIFTDGEMPKECVSQTQLGKIKVEKIFEHGVKFNGLKNYAELDEKGNPILANEKEKRELLRIGENDYLDESKILKGSAWKLKGVSNSAQMLNKNTFIQQEWSGCSKQAYYERFGKQKGHYWIITKQKQIKEGNIKKGIVEMNGDISPFKLQDFK